MYCLKSILSEFNISIVWKNAITLLFNIGNSNDADLGPALLIDGKRMPRVGDAAVLQEAGGLVEGSRALGWVRLQGVDVDDAAYLGQYLG